ncbi:MAG: hypothetical protein ABSB82_11560 [Terriglobia bacterium]|jgi:hypothetical protein
MASKRRKPPMKGTLMRGAEGDLYFIPNNKLRAFRVLDEHTETVSAEFDRLAVERKGQLTPARTFGDCHGIEDWLKTPGRRKPRSK